MSDGARFLGTCFACEQHGNKAVDRTNARKVTAEHRLREEELQQPRRAMRKLDRPGRQAVGNRVIS